jgi:hypothetical protein
MTITRVIAIVLFFVAMLVAIKLPMPAGGIVGGLALGGLSWYASRLKRGPATNSTKPPVSPRKNQAGTTSISTPVQQRTVAPQSPPQRVPAATPEDPALAALLRVIEEKRKTDPLIGAKIGAKEVSQRLLNGMKTEKGVHIESLLCALGAVAGYSCQANLRAQAVMKGIPETAPFTVVKTADGRQYFFGDPLNQALAEAQLSVWGLAAGAARQAGSTTLPDIQSIFKRVSETVGHETFGIPQLPENHRAGDLPINYVKALWPVLLPIAKQFCQKPSEWPVLFGLSIQDAIEKGKSVIAPDLALKIVMESAIPMSKIDLASA